MNYSVTYNKTTESVLDGISKSLQVAKAGEYLVCAELILQGYNAMLSDAGSPYDILVELSNGRFIKIQVKSTCDLLIRKPTINRKYGTSPAYRFAIRRSRTNDRRVDLNKIDYFAFVALDRRLIAFLKASDVATKDGKCKITMDFKTRQIQYEKNGSSGTNPNNVGKFIEDFWKFNP